MGGRSHEVMSRQYTHIIQRADCVNPPAAGILQAALYPFTVNSYMEELQQNIDNSVNPINMKEVATSVVYLVTKETVTKYRKFVSDPRIIKRYRHNIIHVFAKESKRPGGIICPNCGRLSTKEK